jgi:hypothetical protein
MASLSEPNSIFVQEFTVCLLFLCNLSSYDVSFSFFLFVCFIGCDTVLKNVVLRPLGITKELKSWMDVMESHPSLGRVSVEV